MGTALEVLGLALPYSSGIPAVYPGWLIRAFVENLSSPLHREGPRVFQSSQVLEKFDGTRPQTKVRLICAALRHISNDAKSLRDIVTRQSFLNAIAVINIIGGSTNAVCCHPLLPFPLDTDERTGPAPSRDG